MATRWLLVDPVAQRVPNVARADDQHVRALRRLGLLSNNKQNAAEVLRSVGTWMQDQHGVELSFYHKSNASIPATTGVIDDIVASCDALITGSADCGSCTASAVHDVLNVAGRGIPVALLASEKFVELAHFVASGLQAPDPDLVVVTHPIGGVTDVELQQRCQEAIDQVEVWWKSMDARRSSAS